MTEGGKMRPKIILKKVLQNPTITLSQCKLNYEYDIIKSSVVITITLGMNRFK